MTLISNIVLASIVTAFDDKTIGSKVINTSAIHKGIILAVEETDFEDQRVPGQALIPLPNLLDAVSGGVGKHTQNPSDYVKRLYRGKVRLFLRRELAEPVESLSVVVYTKEAYLNDPDVLGDPKEVARIEEKDPTHVLVAVLASAGPQSPLSPGRLVHNLAGGNNEALEWGADEIREKARESIDYYNNWGTVAD